MHAGTKSKLIAEIERTIELQGITQAEAARLCRADAAALSKVLRGRWGSVTIDKLADWLIALGRPVEIRVGAPVARATDRAILKAVSSFEEGG